MRAGPVRDTTPPAYGTRREALADSSVRPLAGAGRLLGSALGLGLVVAVATAPACSYGCITICPTVYLSEDEALDIVQEQFAAHGYTLQAGAGSGPMDLPFEPDLANWDAGLIAEIVTEEECPEVQQIAEDLLATGNERCGLGAEAPLSEPRQRSYDNCAQLTDGTCYPHAVAESLAACLNFACVEVTAFVAEPGSACEDDPDGADGEMRAEVDDFFEALEAADAR